MVANHAVMGYMRQCHKQAITANARLLTFAGSAVDRRPLADGRAVTDIGVALFPFEFEILRIFADRRPLEDMAVLADFRPASNDHMRANHSAFTNFYILANHRIRANLNIRRNLSPRPYDCGFMYMLCNTAIFSIHLLQLLQLS